MYYEYKFLYLAPLKVNINKNKNMTKAEIVLKISKNLGLEKSEVLATVENLMKEIKGSLNNGENVYLRGFGSFIVKKRAEKTGRNISKNITIRIPEHHIPAFKPAKVFTQAVKDNN
jgi:DNA-binding protein HU-beta|tara:strand:- start:39 stop:386 length:348 start_codon:yes stop_codon:yes gene_type:complete